MYGGSETEGKRSPQGNKLYGADANVYNDIDSEITTEFTGYDKLTDTAEIAFLTTSDDVVEALSDGDKGSVIVPNTPFYATMGGQQGDKGIIRLRAVHLLSRIQ